VLERVFQSLTGLFLKVGSGADNDFRATFCGVNLLGSLPDLAQSPAINQVEAMGAMILIRLDLGPCDDFDCAGPLSPEQ
jgi:hypothetical protein